MSFYRQPSSREMYRSPVRALENEREIRDEMNMRRTVQNQNESRRLLDQISLLKIKLRKGDQLQDRCIILEKQNASLAHENDALTRELTDKRFQLQRYRTSAAQNQERETIKSNQVLQLNRSLELEIELLKKERLDNNKLYENQFQKLQIMLQEKMRDLESLSLRYNDLANEKQVSQIEFEEELNKLKNMMARGSHEMERQYEFNRQKILTENNIEIDHLRKNHSSQIMLLEDEISKQKAANRLRYQQFEQQLIQNKNLKDRYEIELRSMAIQNQNLRTRLIKLQDMNKSQVQTIKQKYNDIHHQGQNTLIEQHNRQMRILLEEIEKLKWLLQEKNNQIQNLVKEKRDLRKASDEKQLEYTSTIEALKHRLHEQEDMGMAERHQLMERINILTDKLNRQSDSYHERVKIFNKRISQLQAEIKYKHNIMEKNVAQADIKYNQMSRVHEELRKTLQNISNELKDVQQDRNKENSQAGEYRTWAEKEFNKLGKELKDLQVKNEAIDSKFKRASEGANNNEELLKAEIVSLRENISILEGKLSDQQSRHTHQMKQLSEKLRKRIEQLQRTQQQTLNEVELSKRESIETLNRRVEKLLREKKGMEQQLNKYVKMYEDLEKYFPNPHEGTLYQQKGENNVYEALSKTAKSSLHIF